MCSFAGMTIISECFCDISVFIVLSIKALVNPVLVRWIWNK